ncbi:hypothetical protein FSP39_019065 [Pinctada imbricata]|uniref:RNA-directed DNA polymerase n=1 Tax=Pinctada imbricata TaxID=66713 RepID=A0AA88YNI2_PINIB|nr:hypothetical protein FSP39_019065 [Pinctada imbricata]
MLVDTGSSVTIIKKDVYDLWPEENRPVLEPVRMNLVTATGDSASFLGKTTVNIKIGEKVCVHDVLLADIQCDGILGMDFLSKYECDLQLGQGYLVMGGQKVICYSDSDLENPLCCRVSITEEIRIPAESEIPVTGKIIDPFRLGSEGIVEPFPEFVNNSGVLPVKCYVSCTENVLPIYLVNFSREPCVVRKNTVAAVFEEIIPISRNDEQGNDSNNTIKFGQQAKVSEVRTENKYNRELPPHLRLIYDSCDKDLDTEERIKVKNFLRKHQDLFSKSDKDIGQTSLVEHTIETGDTRPIKQRPYRIPLAKRFLAEAEIRDMAERGIIEPSNSPWCSNLVMVTKKDGSVRFCLDFRKLNACTIKDSQPLPRIDDTLDALSGAKWFSTLDCKSGYWQVSLAEKDRPKTAFSIAGGGLWQFTVMPFGLCNAPATFERLMEYVLAGLSWVKCLVFLDDIIVFSKSNFDDHLLNLSEVFERLKSANLKLSPKKCVLFKKEVNYLGHVVSAEGVKTDPKKIESIIAWPTPCNVREVRSFLGLCSYYRRFVKDFASKAKPLHKLTEKNIRFEWSKDCEASFQALKQWLTEAPILSYPIESGDFIIDTDASNVGLGGVLSQVQNGVEVVISYFSRCFSKCERRYFVTRRELLAVVAIVKQFHHYLYGRRFLVRSDHGALRWIMNFKKPEGQVARWIEVLSTYDFQVEHRQGRVHNNADALSRRPCYGQKCPYCEKAEVRYDEGLLQEAAHPISRQLDNLESFEGGMHNESDASEYGVKVVMSSMRQSDPKDGVVDSMDTGPVPSSKPSDSAQSMDMTRSRPREMQLLAHQVKLVQLVQTGAGERDEVSLDLLRQEQEADPILGMVKLWKLNGVRPSCILLSG